MRYQLGVGSVAIVILNSLLKLATADDGPPHDRDFQPRFRIECAGQILNTGEFGGHSAPSVTDIDGDGLPDLVVGAFTGQLQFYRNVGNGKEFKYVHSGFLQADGAEIQMVIYCCIGAQPRFADMNGDQLLDLLTNSYDPGHCHLFLRNRDGSFARDIVLSGRDGQPIRASVNQKEDHESFGSFYETVDWDNDGDLDLLIGCFDGTLKLRINEGDKNRFLFANDNQTIAAGSAPLQVAGHCCPVVADWNSDGLWDIIVGSVDGSVTWFQNVGDREKPAFSAGLVLIPPSPDKGVMRVLTDDSEARPGIRSQVEVADLNGDGKLDLLVGDYFTAFDLRTDLNSNERVAATNLIKDFDSERDKFYEQAKLIEQDVLKRYPNAEFNSRAAKEEYRQAFDAYFAGPQGVRFQAAEREFYRKLRPFFAGDLSEDIAEHNAMKSHGHIWVYLRK